MVLGLHTVGVNTSGQVSVHLLSVFLPSCQAVVVFNLLKTCHTVFHHIYFHAQRHSLLIRPPPHFLTTANMEGIVTIMGLKPETRYSVRLAALNGKGLGEISAATEFKTQPVRKYSQLLCLSPQSHSSLFSSGTDRDPIVPQKIAFDFRVPMFLVAHSTSWFSGTADLHSFFSKCVEDTSCPSGRPSLLE